MSKRGVELVAGLLSCMQETRIELLRGGDKQNMRLGQMLEKAKDHIKDEFAEITMEESDV